MAMNAIIGDGNFEFIEREEHIEMYKNMYSAISRCELWKWLREYIPEEDKGSFFNSKRPEVYQIMSKMKEIDEEIATNHSGSSFFYMLREMEYIAKNSYDDFKRGKTSNVYN